MKYVYSLRPKIIYETSLILDPVYSSQIGLEKSVWAENSFFFWDYFGKLGLNLLPCQQLIPRMTGS